MIASMPRDRKTRFQGVYGRHQKECRIEDGAQRCNCDPTFYGKVYDRSTRKTIRTRRLPTPEIARSARNDLLAELAHGNRPANRGLKLTDARERFVRSAREGKALNKNGRRYKPTSIDNIEISLKRAEKKLGHKPITAITRGDVQTMVIDELAPTLSGSRVRNIVNSIRALYAWAQDRDLANHDPAQRVRLPAMNATPISRVATATEFAQLLQVLDVADAVAYGLAGYAGARAEQIRRLRWKEVDFDQASVELGIEWEAAKYDASHRVVPLLPHLRRLLRALYIKRGRPAGDTLVLPPRHHSKTGLTSMPGIQGRADKAWSSSKLDRITFQESRHSLATWLDAAGVSPRIASHWMGHAVPKQQLGAAAITLQRYTHTLPEDVITARDQLAAYLTKTPLKDAI